VYFLMIGLLRPATTMLMIAAMLTGAPVSGHFHRCACLESSQAEPDACGMHQHGRCESHALVGRSVACVEVDAASVPARPDAHDDPCPNCPTCPTHGTCGMCGAGQTMALLLAWMPAAANLVISRTSTDHFIGYEFLLGSELLRPPAASLAPVRAHVV
jgi:hypothetical protein